MLQADEIDKVLHSIQSKIVAGHYQEALVDLAECEKDIPDNTELLYMQAVCQRYLKNYDDAINTLAVLKSNVPEHGRAYQEEGHIYKYTGQPDRALQAYSQACRYNPALLASWEGQLEIYSNKGLENHVSHIKNELDYLKGLPRPLIAVMDLIAQGRLLKAEDVCRQFLQQVPHHVEAMRLLADIGVRFGVLDDAEFLLQSALELDPENTRVRIDYIQVLRKRQNFQEALSHAKYLLDIEAGNPQYKSLYAIVSMQTGDYDQAIKVFDEILKVLPNDPVTLTSRGQALKTTGDYDEAVRSFQAATSNYPQYGEAYYALANLKIYSFEDNEIKRLHEIEQNSELPHVDKIYICFALGKAYEDREEFETSFKYYERGNQLKKIQCRYDAIKMHNDLAAQHYICTVGLFEKNKNTGCQAPDPVFIVGMPRAGSTLLEQIISSHSQVDGTMELPNILSLTHRLRRRDPNTGKGNRYPEILNELNPEQLREFGENFIRDTQVHRQDAPRFIDKMPNNFRHIGLIKLILPNAKIIDARRNAMSCCFSNFKQLFAEGQEFTYGLEEVGQYYSDYVDLMAHWNKVLPGYILRVNYEDVVADLEQQVKRILEFLQLPFEEQCLEFHKTERAVRTPSSEQVRQPIYTSGLEQWKNFEPWLGPLKAALQPASNL